jgi:hypothetical protein
VIAGLSFYEVTNQKIKSLATSALASLDEFNLTIVSINTQLPNGNITSSSSTGTIGVQLYQKKALLNFLNKTYFGVNSTNTTAITTTYSTLVINF